MPAITEHQQHSFTAEVIQDEAERVQKRVSDCPQVTTTWELGDAEATSELISPISPRPRNLVYQHQLNLRE